MRGLLAASTGFILGISPGAQAAVSSGAVFHGGGAGIRVPPLTAHAWASTVSSFFASPAPDPASLEQVLPYLRQAHLADPNLEPLAQAAREAAASLLSEVPAAMPAEGEPVQAAFAAEALKLGLLQTAFSPLLHERQRSALEARSAEVRTRLREEKAAAVARDVRRLAQAWEKFPEPLLSEHRLALPVDLDGLASPRAERAPEPWQRLRPPSGAARMAQVASEIELYRARPVAPLEALTRPGLELAHGLGLRRDYPGIAPQTLAVIEPTGRTAPLDSGLLAEIGRGEVVLFEAMVSQLSYFALVESAYLPPAATEPAGETPLERHGNFFAENSGRATLASSYRQIRRLGLGRTLSGFVALGAVPLLAFLTAESWLDYLRRPFSVTVARLRLGRHGPVHTGVFGPDGELDLRQFERVFEEFAGGRDQITARELGRMRRGNFSRGFTLSGAIMAALGWAASVLEFVPLMTVAADRAAREGGRLVPAISRARLLRFYEGTLLWELAARRPG